VNPSLSLNGGYNDNILFNSTEPVDDFYTSVKPEIDLGFSSELYEVKLKSQAELLRYLEENDLDEERYRHELAGNHRLCPRWNLSGALLYIQDTTLQSELEESGRVLNLEDRKLYQGNSTVTYSLDEISEIEVEYLYQSIEYESNDRIDRISHSVRLPYNRWFNDHLDRLMLRPSYTKTETEDNRDIDFYNFSVGWTHIFSETLIMTNYVGYGYAIATENGDRESTQGGNADFSITQTDETLSFRIGLRSDIRLDTEGELEEVDRLYCRIRKKITERLSAIFDGRLYINRLPEAYDSIDSVLYDIKPELSYEITENHYLNAFYRYSYEEDQTVSENRHNMRNVIELNIVFRYPIQK